MSMETERPIRLREPAMLLLVLVLLISAGCTSTSYWDGGEYRGKPVYSREEGMTKACHHELELCRISEDWLEAVTRMNCDHCDFENSEGHCIRGLDEDAPVVMAQGGVLCECWWSAGGYKYATFTKYRKGGQIAGELGTLRVEELEPGVYQCASVTLR